MKTMPKPKEIKVKAVVRRSPSPAKNPLSAKKGKGKSYAY